MYQEEACEASGFAIIKSLRFYFSPIIFYVLLQLVLQTFIFNFRWYTPNKHFFVQISWTVVTTIL